MRKRALLGVAVAAGWLMCVCGVSQGAAQGRPLPPLPKLGWELFLPEEYDGCGVMYGIYARLPEAERGRLHAGEKVYVDPSGLSGDAAAKIATWFNSARWGCDPPEGELDASAVRSATIVLKCEDEAVEFCLRSPNQRIWKKLTIACAPERAEWVRDGLPLLPHWIYVSWEGGHHPPRPTISLWGTQLRWQSHRGVYRVYAEQPAERLRSLHVNRELRLSFSELSRAQQDALTKAVDSDILLGNKSIPQPAGRGRSPEDRAKHFGISEVVFEYRRSHPGCPYPLENNLPGVDPCPRPFRQVFIALDARYQPSPDPEAGSKAFVVALPAPLQRSLLEWRRANDEWTKQWTHRSENGRTVFLRDGAPPRPRHPR